MKKIMFGAMALISLSVSASAFIESNIPNMTVTASTTCANNEEGYYLEARREGTTKAVTYDSCSKISGEKSIVVKDSSSNSTNNGNGSGSLSETVTINGVDVYFPNGYTIPTVAADNTCNGGFNITSHDVDCAGENDPISGDTLSKGWENLIESTGDLFLKRNDLTNIDALKNLTKVEFFDIGETLITTLDALQNLRTVNDELAVNENPSLSDISGLNSLEYVRGKVVFDNRVYEIKLRADSYLCLNFDKVVASITDGEVTPPKSYICNP